MKTFSISLHKLLAFSVLINLFYSSFVSANEVIITSPQGLIDLSNAVNGGANYSGTTVYLGADIDFSGKTLEPIGVTDIIYFLGSFDGQGHVISNLKMKSTLPWIGLFVGSYGITIKNTVIDSTCSFESTYSTSSGNSPRIGAFIGSCSGITIESCVNMASVTYSGSVSTGAFAGGFSGVFGSLTTQPGIIRNCANYGAINYYGKCECSEIGGFVGEYWGTNHIYIQNCANYGSITGGGSTNNYMCLGGIGGLLQASYIDSCFNAGTITATGSARTKNTGNIIGRSFSNTNINYCYYTSGTGVSSLYSYQTPASTTGSSSSAIDVSTAVTNLNNRASSNSGWNKWITNTNNAAVTFKVNSNKGFSVSKQAILLPDPSSTDGNVFSGWYKDAGYTQLFQSTSVTSATTLYGLYKIGIKVTFNPNGGSVSTASKRVSYYSTYGDLPTGTKTGYSLSGWFTAASGGTEIKSSTKVTITVPQTLYAHWTANPYKVTFDKNGGDTVSKTSTTVTYDSTYGTLATANRTGYTFAGWFNAKTGGNEVKPSTKVTTAKDHSIYARWTANKYNITFEINKGDTVSKTTITVTYDGTYGTLPTGTKTGYTFAGWFTEEEGGDKIEPTTKVNVTAAQSLYAHWTANTYTITFNTTTADGDVLQQPSQQGFYDSEYGTLPEPERTGYTFAGWFTEEDGQGERITEDTNVTIAANHTLYGHWTINNYTIRFEYGNGADAEERVLDFNEPINYTEDLVREGYTFAGWDMKPDTVPAEDLIIKALWTPNNYTLSFDVSGGEGVGDESELEVVYDEFYGSLPEPTKTGYTFAGWFTEEGGQGDKIETGAQVKVTGDVTLYAQWSINQYTITFEVDGGSECENITQDYNTEVVLPEPTKTGYTFDCWCSDPELRNEYTETTMPAGNVTLYSKWSINQYNLTFVFNNGAENEVRTLDFNSKIDYPENLKKEGYTFNGWDSKPDKMPAENITVTAQWVSIEEPEKPTKPTNPTEYVEIVFGKDFTEEEVKDILDDYTKEGFTIVEFERDEKTGEARVIVKFNDSKDAEEFVENIDKNGKPEHFFREVGFASGKSSFSSILAPFSLLLSMTTFIF